MDLLELISRISGIYAIANCNLMLLAARSWYFCQRDSRQVPSPHQPNDQVEQITGIQRITRAQPLTETMRTTQPSADSNIRTPEGTIPMRQTQANKMELRETYWAVVLFTAFMTIIFSNIAFIASSYLHTPNSDIELAHETADGKASWVLGAAYYYHITISSALKLFSFIVPISCFSLMKG